MSDKLPPREKIFEAWSALAANRLKLLAPADAPSGQAELLSSDGAKSYRLSWQGSRYASTDSATWWQAYPGYPILALLMLQGKLPHDPQIAALFRAIDWHAVNAKHKRDYAAALEEVMNRLQLTDEQRHKANELADQTMRALENLDLATGRFYSKKKAQ